MGVKIPYDNGIYHVYHVVLFLYSHIDLFFSIPDVINVKQSIYLRYNSSSHTLHTSAELFFSKLVYRKKCHACHLINKRYRIPEGQSKINNKNKWQRNMCW
jgi:hypothetical protein